MQGNPQVIAELNSILTGELTAADQYFIHSKMYENWGFHKLYARIDHERVEELDHASRVIRRILFLNGTPNVAARGPLAVGKDVPEMLKNDLAYEFKVISDLKRVIQVCEKAQDFETRQLLLDLLADSEEDHAHWLEIQLGLIERIGIENYLQTSIGEGAKNESK